MTTKKTMTTRQAALYLGYTTGSFRVLLSRGKGPKSERPNGYNREFDKDTLDAWKKARRKDN